MDDINRPDPPPIVAPDRELAQRLGLDKPQHPTGRIVAFFQAGLPS